MGERKKKLSGDKKIYMKVSLFFPINNQKWGLYIKLLALRVNPAPSARPFL